MRRTGAAMPRFNVFFVLTPVCVSLFGKMESRDNVGSMLNTQIDNYCSFDGGICARLVAAENRELFFWIQARSRPPSVLASDCFLWPGSQRNFNAAECFLAGVEPTTSGLSGRASIN